MLQVSYRIVADFIRKRPETFSKGQDKRTAIKERKGVSPPAAGPGFPGFRYRSIPSASLRERFAPLQSLTRPSGERRICEYL
jgi:hypothetical protein